MLHSERPRGRLPGDYDGLGPSTIGLVSSGESAVRAAAISNRQIVASPDGVGSFVLPWGSVGVGMISLVVILLYLDGRILR